MPIVSHSSILLSNICNFVILYLHFVYTVYLYVAVGCIFYAVRHYCSGNVSQQNATTVWITFGILAYVCGISTTFLRTLMRSFSIILILLYTRLCVGQVCAKPTHRIAAGGRATRTVDACSKL